MCVFHHSVWQNSKAGLEAILSNAWIYGYMGISNHTKEVAKEYFILEARVTFSI